MGTTIGQILATILVALLQVVLQRHDMTDAVTGRIEKASDERTQKAWAWLVAAYRDPAAFSRLPVRDGAPVITGVQLVENDSDDARGERPSHSQ